MSEPVRWGILSTALINEKFLAGAPSTFKAVPEYAILFGAPA